MAGKNFDAAPNPTRTPRLTGLDRVSMTSTTISATSPSLVLFSRSSRLHGQAANSQARSKPNRQPSRPRRRRVPSAIRLARVSRSKVIAAALAAGRYPQFPGHSHSNGT